MFFKIIAVESRLQRFYREWSIKPKHILDEENEYTERLSVRLSRRIAELKLEHLAIGLAIDRIGKEEIAETDQEILELIEELFPKGQEDETRKDDTADERSDKKETKRRSPYKSVTRIFGREIET